MKIIVKKRDLNFINKLNETNDLLKGVVNMQKEITIEMIDKFNEHMEICNSIIILSKRENENIVDITLSSRRFIESFIINPRVFNEKKIFDAYKNKANLFAIEWRILGNITEKPDFNHELLQLMHEYFYLDFISIYFGNCPKSGIMRSCACWELDDLGNWVVCTTDEDGDGVNATYDCPTCSLPCQQLDENGLHLVVPAGDPDNPADWTCDNDFGDGDGSNQTVPADCACGDVGALAPANWPEDVLEDVYYGLTEFLRFGTTQLMKDRTDLVNNFDSWYGELAMWIEPLNPPADRTTVPACYNCSGTATEAAEGILWQWRDALAEIRDRLNLLSVSHVAQAGNLCGNAWCVPMPACATFVGAHEEHDKEENTFDSNSNGVIGDIEDVAACLNYNINDQRILLAVDLALFLGDNL